MATSWAIGLAAAALLVGVAPATGQEASTPANRDRRVITTEEIEKSQANDTYQVVQKLRPEFLRRMSQPQTLGGGVGPRAGVPSSNPGGGGAGGGGVGMTNGATGGNASEGAFSQPEPPRSAAVFVDGTEMGGVDELKRLSSNLVEEIRYLSSSDAETRYGPRFSAGVIEVKLKTR